MGAGGPLWKDKKTLELASYPGGGGGGSSTTRSRVMQQKLDRAPTTRPVCGRRATIPFTG